MLKKLTGIAMAIAMGFAVVVMAVMVETESRRGATTATVASR